MMTGLGKGAGSSADQCSPFLHRSSFRAVSIAAVGIDQRCTNCSHCTGNVSSSYAIVTSEY